MANETDLLEALTDFVGREGGFISALRYPAVNQLRQSAMEAKASRNVARAALFTHEYKVRTGSLPASFDDLAQELNIEVPVDVAVHCSTAADGSSSILVLSEAVLVIVIELGRLHVTGEHSATG